MEGLWQFGHNWVCVNGVVQNKTVHPPPHTHTHTHTPTPTHTHTHTPTHTPTHTHTHPPTHTHSCARECSDWLSRLGCDWGQTLWDCCETSLWGRALQRAHCHCWVIERLSGKGRSAPYDYVSCARWDPSPSGEWACGCVVSVWACECVVGVRVCNMIVCMQFQDTCNCVDWFYS